MVGRTATITMCFASIGIKRPFSLLLSPSFYFEVINKQILTVFFCSCILHYRTYPFLMCLHLFRLLFLPIFKNKFLLFFTLVSFFLSNLFSYPVSHIPFLSFTISVVYSMAHIVLKFKPNSIYWAFVQNWI